MRKALVTGACGVMGLEMVEFLLEHGFQVRATDLPDADREMLKGRAEFIPSDLRLPSTLNKLFDGVSRCYHLAEVSDSEATFVDIYNANVIGTRNLLRASLPGKAGLEAIVVRSAAGVYGHFTEGPFKEDHFLDPKDDFHKTMAAREELALDFERTANLPVILLRLAPVYSDSRKWGEGPAVHARDAVRAAHFASDRSGFVGDTFNLDDDADSEGLDSSKICSLGFTLHYPQRKHSSAGAERSATPEIGSV